MFVDPFDRTARGVIHSLKGCIPLQSNCRRTSHAGLRRHTLGGTVAGEVLSEDAAIVVLFLVLWWVDGEAFGSVSHLLIGDSLGGDAFQRVNP